MVKKTAAADSRCGYVNAESMGSNVDLYLDRHEGAHSDLLKRLDPEEVRLAGDSKGCIAPELYNPFNNLGATSAVSGHRIEAFGDRTTPYEIKEWGDGPDWKVDPPAHETNLWRDLVAIVQAPGRWLEPTKPYRLFAEQCWDVLPGRVGAPPLGHRCP